MCAYRFCQVMEVLRMLAAQVLEWQSVELKCWKFCRCWMQRYLCACLSVGLKYWNFCCWESCANTLYAIPSSLQTSWLHRYLCAYRFCQVLEVLRMLAAQVLEWQSVELKCWKFCRCWMQRYLCACLSVGLKCWKFCWESCANTLYVGTIFLSEKLAAQVLQCVSVGLMCRERFAAKTLYVSAIFPSEMLDAQVQVCLSVGLKCWRFCWESCANTLYAIPSSLQTSWLNRYLCAYRLCQVLEVLRMLAAQVLECQ